MTLAHEFMPYAIASGVGLIIGLIVAIVRVVFVLPAKRRIQELEAGTTTLRSALQQVGRVAGSGTCCCGEDMDNHSLSPNHSPVDQVTHFIDLTLDQTDHLVQEQAHGST